MNDHIRPFSMSMTTSRAQLEVSLPDRIPNKYWTNTNHGLSYAMYSLVHMSRDDTTDLLHAIRFHVEADTPAFNLKVVRAPIHDFCTNNKTLKDIYDYVRYFVAPRSSFGLTQIIAHLDLRKRQPRHCPCTLHRRRSPGLGEPRSLVGRLRLRSDREGNRGCDAS